ncbi:MAG: hypothetical protein ACRD0F_08330 [Acidimicrobiales bacterium]
MIGTSGVSAGRVEGDEAALRRVLRDLGDNAARHARGHVAFALAERGAAWSSRSTTTARASRRPIGHGCSGGSCASRCPGT